MAGPIDRFKWRSGGLAGTPQDAFWTPNLTAVDPQIPNLPLDRSQVTLYLRNTTTNGISIGGEPCYDLLTTPGSSADTAVVNTTASGTEIQFTKTAGGSVAAFITGRVPAGGWTITSSDVALWLQESAATVNAGLRFRLFKYSGGTETELGGSPFTEGTEFNTTNTLETVVGEVTDTALAEDDRLLLRVYAVNVGTMAVGTATLRFNGQSQPAAFRSSSNLASATNGALAVPKPVGLAVGDLILIGYTGYLTGTPTSPAGFPTIVKRTLATPDGEDLGYTYKIADSSDVSGSTFTVTFAAGSDITLVAAAIQNVDATAPFSFTPVRTSSGASNTTPISMALASGTANANDLVLVLAGTDQTVAADRWSNSFSGDGYTTREDVASIDWSHVSVHTKGNVSAGAIGTINGTATRVSGTGNSGWQAYVFSVKSTLTYGDSYINVYPAVTFKAEGGGSSAALTGSQSTSAAGTLTPVVTQPLTSALSTGSAGTLRSALTQPLIGAENTGYAGTVMPNQDYSKALTGSQSTSQTGSLVSTVTQPLTGAQATGQAGTPTTVNATPMTGAQATSSAGTLVSSIAQNVAGSSSTSDTGTISPVGGDGGPSSQPLTGSQSTASAGTVSPVISGILSGDYGLSETGTLRSVSTQPLTGSQVTGSAGTVVSSIPRALTGQQATANAGQVVPAITQPLTGAQSVGQAGSVGASATYVQALSGSSVAASAGTLGVAVTGVLSGAAALASAGTVTPVGGDTATEQTGSGWLSLAKRRGAR